MIAGSNHLRSDTSSNWEQRTRNQRAAKLRSSDSSTCACGEGGRETATCAQLFERAQLKRGKAVAANMQGLRKGMGKEGQNLQGWFLAPQSVGNYLGLGAAAGETSESEKLPTAAGNVAIHSNGHAAAALGRKFRRNQGRVDTRMDIPFIS